MELSGLQIAVVTVIAVLSVVGVALFARTVGHLVRVIRVGQPDPTRGGQAGARAYSLFAESLGHARLGKWPLVGIMHWLVFVGFGALFFTLVTAYGQVVDPEFALPLVGRWVVYEWVTEIIGWLTLVAIVALIVVRQKAHPRSAAGEAGRRSRFFGSTFWQAYYVEFTIAAVAVCVITLRGLEYALGQALGGESAHGAVHFPLTFWIGNLFSGASAGALENAIVLVAALKIVVSMAWFITIALQPTMGVAWHRFLAFPNIWFKRHPGKDPERGLVTSLGALQPVMVKGAPLDFEQMDELDEDDALGVGKVEDFTWKGLLDFTTCTECGRCQSQCPAWNTDKPLSPKLAILALRDHAHAKAPWLLAAQTPGGAEQRDALDAATKIAAARPLVGDTGWAESGDVLRAYNPGGEGAEGLGVIDPDVLWSCTTCGACVEQCPVDIEHVDHIVDMRRNQVLIESAFPSELGGLFKNLEKNSNPWGMSPRLRMDWAKGLPFEVKQVGTDVEDLSEVEYLFWVGCAGAFEDRQKKTTRAIAELLNTAGVTFAVLGDGEGCTGDPARRSGNEFLFQMLAQANVEMLNEVKATKVVVSCAHCFNTLKNEYPQLGGSYEVVHHTQLLNKLVRERRLLPVAPLSKASVDAPKAPAAGAAAPTGGAKVTYHDPCYIGRHNGVYTPPRELIGALPGVTLEEMPRNSNRSFCCGAGGARMWMEEKLGQRINSNRTEEAVATGADKIAVACPFCRVMLSDGLTTQQAAGNASDEVEVVDVAQMLLAAVKRADDDKAPAAATV
ncbi:(Fe-S)-binding protein [Kineosporia sp. R_H_3]|uniref:(Fe-S)-binding protein n=1 Tax=Kineosporia sp. R_H_3 TaxID=1961848 RepID=UPI000B4AB1D2|nr:(Fe-S)-binding protein [Kineosporia sp. R_H_3]